jgi:3-dehydroquinate synthase
MSIVNTIQAEFDGCHYPIMIGKKLLGQIDVLIAERTKNRKILIVADIYFQSSAAKRIIDVLQSSGFEVFSYYMNAGKGNKNINEVLKIFGLMEENNFARDSTLVAIGGGVIGDLAGFVSSTWLRGMNLVHVPTSLMSMVDSSVGGKVAINFRRTINAIGNYYHPILNLMDLDFVDTLSDRDFYSGIAEVIKCGIIADHDFFEHLNNNSQLIQDRDHQSVIQFISRALEIKIAHVRGDTREGGKRLLLNYGHTLGHAIEISTERHNKELFRHGEGVSIGIMAAAWIAENHLDLSSDLYLSFKKLFLKYHLPVCVDCNKHGFDREKLIKACLSNVHKDKKRIDNHLRLILSPECGSATVYSDVPLSLVEQAFEHIIR